MKKKNILVVGGAGYIGTGIVKELINDGYDIFVIDNLSNGQKAKLDKKAKFAKVDILDKSKLEKIFKENKFDTVIHLAAKKSAPESEQNPSQYFENNVSGTINILHLMAKYKIPQIIFSSTASLYKPKNTAHKEKDKLEPANVYGKTKLISEEIIKEYKRLGKIKKFIIFRYFNVAGDTGVFYKEKNPGNVFPILAQAARQNKIFYIFGKDYNTKDKTGVRDYIHLSDLIDAHKRALKYKDSDIFNLGTQKGYSVLELVHAFENVIGRKIKIRFAKRRPGDVAISIANPKKAQKLLNWRPAKTLKDMVESTLQVYK